MITNESKQKIKRMIKDDFSQGVNNAVLRWMCVIQLEWKLIDVYLNSIISKQWSIIEFFKIVITATGGDIWSWN
jgi:hypothetical protein